MLALVLALVLVRAGVDVHKGRGRRPPCSAAWSAELRRRTAKRCGVGAALRKGRKGHGQRFPSWRRGARGSSWPGTSATAVPHELPIVCLSVPSSPAGRGAAGPNGTTLLAEVQGLSHPSSPGGHTHGWPVTALLAQSVEAQHATHSITTLLATRAHAWIAYHNPPRQECQSTACHAQFLHPLATRADARMTCHNPAA